MKVLVFLEHQGGELMKGSLGVLAKATTLGEAEVAGVLVGKDVNVLAKTAGKFGAAKVYVAEDEAFDPPLPQSRVDVLEEIVRQGDFDTVLFSNSVLAGDVASGLAARLDAGLNWDLIDLTQKDGQLLGSQPALQDSVLVTVAWRSPQRLALFRAGSFDPLASETNEAQVEQVALSVRPYSLAAKIVEREFARVGGASIEEAEVIVAGGMGLGTAENFALAEELAEALGGMVGATRAAVYAGWYPRAAQVGQTGKTVSPKLYVALGVSGAIQHKVGMQRSKVIVSINLDPGAPIFEISDLGVVGDVHTIVPRLVELVRQRKGGS